LFLGTYTVELDRDDRLPTPAAYGLNPYNALYVMQGFERNLMVLPARTFEALAHRIRSLNVADPAARLLMRLSLGTSQEVRADESGTLAVPASLREFAGLSGQLRIIGLGDYFEVWAGPHWMEQETQLRDAKANSERFSTLTVTTR
jgi:MraZ protein